MFRDGARKSIWQEEIKRFSSEAGLETVFDVAVIGAGITGTSTALKLQEEGKRCILLEAANIGFGTTGGTTAHLNDFFDTTYSEVISNFGQESAELLYKAAIDALNIIRINIQKYNIDCDFEDKTGYLFALDEKQQKQLKDLVEGASKVGHRMSYTHEIPFPIPFQEAVMIPGQAQFHPIKYIRGLCEAFLNLGGLIFEDCRCKEYTEEDGIIRLQTEKGIIKARNLVYATHIPTGVNVLHFMNAPYRSYALGFTLKSGHYPNAVGYDLYDPYRYYRTHEINGRKMIIAGGEDHKSGHADDTEQCFKNLESYLRQYFDIDEIVYSWSSQYFEPADGLPYIGRMPGAGDNVFVSTGFRGNGMMFGTITSKIISDLITEGKSEYEELFDPKRIKPVAGFGNFVKEGADVVFSFIKDKIFKDKLESLTKIKEEEGEVVKYEGESYALYKEANGRMHILKSACTHVQCEIRWNNAEKTWDCPCHGSRFNINGKVLNAPAVKDLQRLDPEEL